MTPDDERPNEGLAREAHPDDPAAPGAEAVATAAPDAGAPEPAGTADLTATEDGRPTPDAPAPDAAANPAAAAAELAATTTDQPPPQLSPIAALPFEIPQPKPWQPGEDELDPTVDIGWERAADHELVAIRPEDIPPMLEAYSAGKQPPLPPVGGPRSWAEGSPPPIATPPPAAARPGSFKPGARFDWEVDPAAAPGGGAAAATLGAYPPLAAVPNSEAGTNLIDMPQAPAATALAPTDRRWRRVSRRAKAGAEAAARPILVLGLFVLGTSIGWTSYLATRPVPQAPGGAPAVAAAQDAGTTTDVPPQILSLITALNADDQNQVQTVVPAEPYRLLAGELAAEGVKSIRGASALQTYSNGRDSVTQILIRATSADGSNFAFNLVVHLQDGVITEFR